MLKKNFPADIKSINQRLYDIKPISYCRNRNYIDGDVTLLSPYISRGVLSTKQVFNHLVDHEFDLNKIEKFIQELAWRDYWQQIWITKGEEINSDLKQPQSAITNHKISSAFLNSQTSINAIDAALKDFYVSGYLHNHIRMYIAAMACNIAKSHWLTPAKWMYYHLLDADWASNALSWQWVVGSNSHKKYVANQENINKYCYSSQTKTYLDVSYQELLEMEVPNELSILVDLNLNTNLPEINQIKLNSKHPTLIYNFYNLDPDWHSELESNRVLLLEPEIFKKYPVSDNTIQFVLELAKNVPEIQLYCGSFEELKNEYQLNQIIYKEHPLNHNYTGTMEHRDWMFNVNGYFPSFFKYWKACKQQLKNH
jgi:deoxyribodipyrimidine photo-lyase